MLPSYGLTNVWVRLARPPHGARRGVRGYGVTTRVRVFKKTLAAGQRLGDLPLGRCKAATAVSGPLATLNREVRGDVWFEPSRDEPGGGGEQVGEPATEGDDVYRVCSPCARQLSTQHMIARPY